MRVLGAGSVFGVLGFLASSTDARVAGAAELSPFPGDSLIDAVMVGILVVMGIGLGALAYKIQSAA